MSRSSQDNLYCRVCVLANERADYNDAPLQRRDVREIFSNARSMNFDIEHDHNYLSGIDIVENYISKSIEDIDGEPIPEGSWMMTLSIVNPQLRSALEEGNYRGVSLETNFTNDVEVTDYEHERLQYRDVVTKEEMMPVTVSFTDTPANMLPIEVMTHQQYTAKNRGDDKMEEERKEDEVTFLRGFVEKLFTGEDKHTSKSMSATPQPQSNSFKYQELIESVIETQKILPSLTQTVEAISESQVKMTESFNNLSQKIDTAVLSTSTESMTTNEDTEADTQQEAQGEAQAEEVLTQEEQEVQPTRRDMDVGTEQQEPQVETMDNQEVKTEEEEEDSKRRTAKNIQGANTQRPLTVNSTQDPLPVEEYKQFMINRSYEHLVGRK